MPIVLSTVGVTRLFHGCSIAERDGSAAEEHRSVQSLCAVELGPSDAHRLT
jgi:hypothetical protein